MGGTGNTVGFQSDTVGQLGLGNHTQSWNKDKISADLLGLEWAAIQGKYYGGKRSVKYVTRGSVIACDKGSQYTRINLPVDHGVETKNTHLPILTVRDFNSHNISSFGGCKMKYGMSSTKCEPKIMSQWTQNANTTFSENAALLQADAFTVCSVGGLICVKEVNKTPQESLMAILKEQYGFDERTTKIILYVYQAIQKKYPEEAQIKRDWRFTRLLGGLKYGLKEKEGWKQEIMWNQTAGDATYALGKDLQVKDYMTGELGLLSEDYEYLQYKVRVQNTLVGEDANAKKYDNQGLDLEKEKYKDDFLENMKTGLGCSLDEPTFIDTWNQQCDDMCGMTDFAHQQITTAAILATEVSEDGWFADKYAGGDRRREQLAGWLGDATLYGKNGEPPSFGNDDYKADLDAENIGHIIKDERYSYIRAVEDYYERRLLDDNRATLFLKINSLEDVKREIYDELIYPEYINKITSTNLYEEKMELEQSYKYENEASWLKILENKTADTYNFLRSLEAELPEMRNLNGTVS